LTEPKLLHKGIIAGVMSVVKSKILKNPHQETDYDTSKSELLDNFDKINGLFNQLTSLPAFQEYLSEGQQTFINQCISISM
jgi:hypothetical protein